jgi:hypothetical protein
MSIRESEADEILPPPRPHVVEQLIGDGADPDLNVFTDMVSRAWYKSIATWKSEALAALETPATSHNRSEAKQPESNSSIRSPSFSRPERTSIPTEPLRSERTQSDRKTNPRSRDLQLIIRLTLSSGRRVDIMLQEGMLIESLASDPLRDVSVFIHDADLSSGLITNGDYADDKQIEQIAHQLLSAASNATTVGATSTSDEKVRRLVQSFEEVPAGVWPRVLQQSSTSTGRAIFVCPICSSNDFMMHVRKLPCCQNAACQDCIIRWLQQSRGLCFFCRRNPMG